MTRSLLPLTLAAALVVLTLLLVRDPGEDLAPTTTVPCQPPETSTTKETA